MKEIYNLIVILLLTSPFAHAQQKQELLTQPLTDPITNCTLRFFYFPNIEAYYDSQKSVYIYSEKGQWITAEELPTGYRGYSVYNKINVMIRDYDDDNPMQFIKIHKKRYPYIHNAKSRDAVLASDVVQAK